MSPKKFCYSRTVDQSVKVWRKLNFLYATGCSAKCSTSLFISNFYLPGFMKLIKILRACNVQACSEGTQMNSEGFDCPSSSHGAAISNGRIKSIFLILRLSWAKECKNYLIEADERDGFLKNEGSYTINSYRVRCVKVSIHQVFDAFYNNE